MITYKNAAAAITLEDATALYNKGVSVAINDGRDITFEVETVSTSEERNMERH